MKTRLCLLIVASLFILAAMAVTGKADSQTNEAKALEGTWAAVSYTGDGEERSIGKVGYIPSADALKTGKLILERNEKRNHDRHHG